MRRREFMALVGGASVLSFSARAQQAGKSRIIGFMGPNAAAWAEYVTAFRERLRALGWIEDNTVVIDYRWSEGRLDRVAEIAAEFARLRVDVIVTYGTAAAILKKTISVIPIVFAVAGDPVGSGLVASLAQPGGNITGLSLQTTDLAGKRVELLREVLPRLRRLAIVVDVGDPQAVLENVQVQAAARTLGLDVASHEVRRAEDIDPAFEALKPQADAVYVASGAVIRADAARVITLAFSARLPTIFNESSFVKAGGLASYGPNYPALFRRAADIVDKIMHDTKPGDIPVEQPTKFESVINLQTAKSLGLTISQTLLATADEVIE